MLNLCCLTDVFYAVIWKTMYASERKGSRNHAAVERKNNDGWRDGLWRHRLVKRTPPWRSIKLMKTLDSPKDLKSDTMPKKDCKTGCPSEPNPPKDLPKWALRDDSTSEPNSSSLSDASLTPESPMQRPMHNQGLTPVSSQSSSLPGLTPLSRFSATHASFHSQTPPSTPRMHDDSTSQSPRNSTSSDSDEDENDETSAWIWAIPGLR